MKLLIINGVNLGLLGKREPEIYGTMSLGQIEELLARYARERGHETEFFQSDLEGELCARIGRADGKYDGIVINAGAYSHTSIALRDAIAATSVPVVEVHMSNIYAREEFRAHSVLSAVCRGTVTGFGANGYILAMESFWL